MFVIRRLTKNFLIFDFFDSLLVDKDKGDPSEETSVLNNSSVADFLHFISRSNELLSP